MDCLFCKIVSGEIPSKKVYEDAHAFAFLDINPCTKGHTLVVPKKHYSHLRDMPDEETAALLAAALAIEKRVVEALQAAGANIGINDGRAAGQEVQHVHVHVIPRYLQDGGGALQSIVRMRVDRQAFDEVVQKLQQPSEQRRPSYDDFFR